MRPKAKYNAPPDFTDLIKVNAPEKLVQFSDELRQKLMNFYPNEREPVDPFFGHPAEQFADILLSEAHFAKCRVEEMDLAITKEELRTTATNLFRALTSARDILRSIPFELDNLLGIDADPRGCADQLDALIAQNENIHRQIEGSPKKAGKEQEKDDIAVEMVIRVLREAKSHGVKIAATGNSYYDTPSDAIQILGLIGAEVGLKYSNRTWEDKIYKARQRVTDL